MTPTATEMIGPDTIRIYDRFFADAHHLAALREHILAQRANKRQSVASLNVGGWKSEIRVLAELSSTPSGRHLVDAIAGALAGVIARPIVSSWAMVNERGARHPWHTHKLAKITGVIYLCADSHASPIQFAGPRPDRGDIRDLVSIPAIAGQMILFPGHVWHQVPEVTGDGVRISLAFDIH